MDRQTAYFGALSRETDVLQPQQFAMIALANLASGVLGNGTLVDAFTCTPTIPASLSVILTPGQIYQLENLEQSTWSSLPADIVHSIVKQGIMLDPATFAITPPGTVGFSQVYLIEVQYGDLDTGALVLPYYNAANPSSPFNGPGNAGTAQNTQRRGIVATQIKAGVAAATGSQVAPTADAGWTGLYLITVAQGQSTVTAGNIVQLASAPFIYPKIPVIPSEAQSGKWEYAVDTGTANAMVVSVFGGTPAPVPGMVLRIKKSGAANTGAVTLNMGGGAINVLRFNGSALSSGDLPAGCFIEVGYDGTQWQTVNYQGISAGTTNNNTFTLTIPFCNDSSGTPNVITAPFSPTITSLANGDMVRVKVANSVTGPTTIAVNAIAAKNVVRPDGSALRQGDVVAGQILILEYDGTVFQAVNLAPAAGLVPGVIYFWPTETPPVGSLECNGNPVSRTTFARLFGIINTMYGPGDGSTTFNLPDLRGEFVRGWDHGRGVDGDAGTRTNRGDTTTGDHVGTKQASSVGPFTATATYNLPSPVMNWASGTSPSGNAFVSGSIPLYLDAQFTSMVSGGVDGLQSGNVIEGAAGVYAGAVLGPLITDSYVGTHGQSVAVRVSAITGTGTVTVTTVSSDTRPRNVNLMPVIAY